MGKNAWLIFSVICILVVVTVLVLMLVLVPQVEYSGTQAGEYENIAKQEYTFTGDTSTLEQEYTVTTKDVEKGKKTDKYEEGNINPFTPKKEVTIYNEPTLKNEGSTTLTPDSK